MANHNNWMRRDEVGGSTPPSCTNQLIVNK
jgi:hypothetical protein